MRHASYANPEHMFAGRSTGFPLSEIGRNEAAAVARYFESRPIAAIVASPTARAMETATIIGKRIGVTVQPDDRLLEVRTPFEGDTMAHLDALGAEIYSPHYASLGVESLEEQSQRMDACLRELISREQGKEVIAVSHGDPIMALYQKYKGEKLDKNNFIPIMIPMAGGFKITIDDQAGVASVERITPAIA